MHDRGGTPGGSRVSSGPWSTTAAAAALARNHALCAGIRLLRLPSGASPRSLVYAVFPSPQLPHAHDGWVRGRHAQLRPRLSLVLVVAQVHAWFFLSYPASVNLASCLPVEGQGSR
ncbi:MAG: hypothetical protein M3264_01735 [Thermoproteota archaeon]|nr:hypothetical protein [Thermoproteota archaeon]